MNWAWATSLDDLWRSPSFPIWVTLAIGTFFALVLLVTLARAEKSIANGALAVITLLAIGTAAAATLRSFGDGDKVVAESRSAQSHSGASLPALACLDGLAGENVEAACEKALFASADSAAAAVSYTAAQITRLTAHGDAAAANNVMTPELSALRRVIERDRYGLVAQVLLVRDQCSPSACDTFRSLANSKQVAANMSERAYEGFIGRHAATWGAPPVATAAAPAAPSLAGFPVTPPTGRPTNADFPTSASIPPVNIMGNEPPAAAPPPPPQPPRSAAAPPAPPAAQPSPPAQPRQATTATAPTQQTLLPPPGAPAPVNAKRQQAQPKQQRTSAPVQLAPPAEPDDN